MNKLLRILALGSGVILVVLAGVVSWFMVKYPDVEPAPSIAVERTAERIARGEYLANYVTVCIDCHSTRDWGKYAGPIIPGTEGKGGEEYNEQVGGVPGTIFASNITPAGVGDYTDAELLWTITTGVTKHKRSLFPLMPYPAFQHLTQDDAYSIVAYLRTLKPIENRVGESSLNFPVNFIVRMITFKSFQPKPEPNRANPVEYGKYLASIGACGDCHTAAEKGERIQGMEYAGGFEFLFPGGVVRSLNITPDDENGIGKWSRQRFIERFKAYAREEMRNIEVKRDEFNTPMPWTMYAMMTEEDLGAIFEYLRTVKPISHRVEKFSASKTTGN